MCVGAYTDSFMFKHRWKYRGGCLGKERLARKGYGGGCGQNTRYSWRCVYETHCRGWWAHASKTEMNSILLCLILICSLIMLFFVCFWNLFTGLWAWHLKSDDFISSFLIPVSCISFSCVIALARVFSITVNRNGEPCSRSWGKSFSFSESTIFAVGLSCMVFTLLRWSSYDLLHMYHKMRQSSDKKTHLTWFLVFLLLVCGLSWADHPSMLGVTCAWSWRTVHSCEMLKPSLYHGHWPARFFFPLSFLSGFGIREWRPYKMGFGIFSALWCLRKAREGSAWILI